MVSPLGVGVVVKLGTSELHEQAITAMATIKIKTVNKTFLLGLMIFSSKKLQMGASAIVQ
jgi:hypothetical protein